MKADIERLIAKVERAHDELAAAIQRQWNGKPAFNMSIPARPEHDSDLVIGAGLDALSELSALPHPGARKERSRRRTW